MTSPTCAAALAGNRLERRVVPLPEEVGLVDLSAQQLTTRVPEDGLVLVGMGTPETEEGAQLINEQSGGEHSWLRPT